MLISSRHQGQSRMMALCLKAAYCSCGQQAEAQAGRQKLYHAAGMVSIVWESVACVASRMPACLLWCSAALQGTRVVAAGRSRLHHNSRCHSQRAVMPV